MRPTVDNHLIKTFVVLITISIFTGACQLGLSENDVQTQVAATVSALAPTGTPILPANNPNSLTGKLVFDKDYDIWIINADGEGLQNLTNTPDNDEIDPVISPDGTTIAFQDLISRNVFTISADGSNYQQITDENALSRSTRWMPDGGKLFICTRKLTENGDMINENYFLDLQSKEKQPIEQCIQGISPGGNELSIIKGKTLTILSPSGENLKEYSLGPSDSMIYSGGNWSPDSKYILFGGYSLDDPNPQKPATSIYILDLASGEIINIINDEYMNNCVSWSPDGQKIAFTSDRLNDQGKLQVFIMNSDGTNIKSLNASIYTDCIDWQSSNISN